MSGRKMFESEINKHLGQYVYVLVAADAGYKTLTLWQLAETGSLRMNGYVDGFCRISTESKEQWKEFVKFTGGAYLTGTTRDSISKFFSQGSERLERLFADQEEKKDRLIPKDITVLRRYHETYRFGEEEKIINKYCIKPFRWDTKDGEIIRQSPRDGDNFYMDFGVEGSVTETENGYEITYYTVDVESYDPIQQKYTESMFGASYYFVPDEDLDIASLKLLQREREKRNLPTDLKMLMSDESLEGMIDSAREAFQKQENGDGIAFEDRNAIYSAVDYTIYHLGTDLPESQRKTIDLFLDCMWEHMFRQRHEEKIENCAGSREIVQWIAPSTDGWWSFVNCRDLIQESFNELAGNNIWCATAQDEYLELFYILLDMDRWFCINVPGESYKQTEKIWPDVAALIKQVISEEMTETPVSNKVLNRCVVLKSIHENPNLQDLVLGRTGPKSLVLRSVQSA